MGRACTSLGRIVLLAALGGCAAKGKSGAAQDTATPAAATPATADDLDTQARELDDYEAQLRALGLAPSRDSEDDGGAAAGGDTDATNTATQAATPEDRCARICALAEAICGIEASVCDLSRAHPDEPKYAEVCARAHDDCELASSACEECGGG